MHIPGVTLLLNASYEPLMVISWQRAVSLFFMEKVEVLSVYDDKDIHSPSLTLKMPSVVRLLRYVTHRLTRVKFSRQNVYARDGYMCQYCGESVAKVELSLDHVIPRCQGGQTTWENITTCCVDCNRKKGARTPEEANMPLIQVPYRPRSMAQLSRKTSFRHTPEDWRDYLI